MTDKETADNSEIIFPIPFLVLMFFIWVCPFIWFMMAVYEFGFGFGTPPTFLEGIFEVFFFPIASVAVFFILLCGSRFVLPYSLKHKLVWDASATYQQEKRVKNDKLAVCSPIMSMTGTVVLIFAKSHIRSDRSQRQPVITWEGPAADYFELLLALGWSLSYLGVITGMVSAILFTSRKNWLSYIGSMLGYGNLFGSFILACALYED